MKIGKISDSVFSEKMDKMYGPYKYNKTEKKKKALTNIIKTSSSRIISYNKI